MRGLFHQHEEDSDTPRLTAKITSMSKGEQSALSKWLDSRSHLNGRAHRKMPCYVFVNHLTEPLNGRDFSLNLSNGTAFIETRTPLSAGQKVSVLFPNGHSLALWHPDIVVRGTAMAALVAIGLAFFALGFWRFVRRDA